MYSMFQITQHVHCSHLIILNTWIKVKQQKMESTRRSQKEANLERNSAHILTDLNRKDHSCNVRHDSSTLAKTVCKERTTFHLKLDFFVWKQYSLGSVLGVILASRLQTFNGKTMKSRVLYFHIVETPWISNTSSFWKKSMKYFFVFWMYF